MKKNNIILLILFDILVLFVCIQIKIAFNFGYIMIAPMVPIVYTIKEIGKKNNNQ